MKLLMAKLNLVRQKPRPAEPAEIHDPFPQPLAPQSPAPENNEHLHGIVGDAGLNSTTARLAQESQDAASLLKSTPSRPLLSEKRMQSLVSPGFLKLVQPDLPTTDYFGSIVNTMVNNRRIWVKRPGASATMVTIHEDDLVDDVRDMILRKYANSLGRSFDSPDVTLRVMPREQQERGLGPEEMVANMLDTYFPGGQTVEEALVIDVPLRRSTPRASPRQVDTYAEPATDYFPQMPVTIVPPHTLDSSAAIIGSVHHPPPHAMSVISTGQVPAIPSPGGTRRRPRVGRTHTNSPQTATAQTPGGISNGSSSLSYANQTATRSRTRSNASEKSNPQVPLAPPLPSPPAVQADLSIQRVATPPPRISSPRPPPNRPKKPRKAAPEHPTLPTGMLNGAVPPINVLIVEDNIINLKLLEAFMKRLKVRWQTAMNGREAVTKWRGGAFHLVLMDIQLPIMSGLQATKEIRRLERLNSIGVFSSSASSKAPEREEGDEPNEDDKLNMEGKFKSPVIIVALTASSLQSDRHEALAAGCNDFLTKPVNFVWLERKVMEWGCMQALIDFDGWRKWKDFNSSSVTNLALPPSSTPINAVASGVVGSGTAGTGPSSLQPQSNNQTNSTDGKAEKKKRKNRSSLSAGSDGRQSSAGVSTGAGRARVSIREETEEVVGGVTDGGEGRGAMIA